MTKEEAIAFAMENIQGWVSPTDMGVLYDLVMDHVPENGRVVEVGSWKGQSTFVLGTACQEKNALLVAIDTFAGVEERDSYKNQPENVGSYYEALQDPGFHQICWKYTKDLEVLLLKGDSQEVHKFLLDRTFDLCFLDGNHDWPVVDMDIFKYIRKVKIGGIISGHDHGNPETDIVAAVDRAFGRDFTTVGTTTIWVHSVKGGECRKEN